MGLKQRVAKLEEAVANRAYLPVMVWHEGERDQAFSRYLAEHGREPETEIEICLVAPKLS